MSHFVLDNSVVMRWLQPSIKEADQCYAEAVLRQLLETEAMVPDLWHLEAANVLLGTERQGQITTAEREHFLAQLESLPIRVDDQTAKQAFHRTMVLAEAYKLSSYDAAYLELALRESLPLATLDKALRAAARKAKVALFLETARFARQP